MVALGYTQIPGIDYTDNFSPVVSDVTLRIVIVIWIVLDLDVDQLDVETAFLEGELPENERVYMKCPEGMLLNSDECLEILKGMYGLCQSSRLFWIKISKILTSNEIGFKRCKSDQCLFVKNGKRGILVFLLYVDDSACFGHKDNILETFRLIAKYFEIKTEGKLNDFLGCEILRNGKDKECWLLQPHLIESLKRNFGDIVKRLRKSLTPGTPRKVIYKLGEDEESLSTKGHTNYRSGVGSLLYLLKHSRPELCNPIRELTKAMHRPGQSHKGEMHRVIKWVIESEDIGLRMKPKITKDENGNIRWILKDICDATWGSSKEDGRSVIGFILYLMDVPISWKSKTACHVTLSSAESEYISSSELVKEILYVKQILEEMGFYVEIPIEVYIDNMGAIFMARNNLGNTATRHVNIRFHFVRELHADGLIIFIYVKSEDNEADIMTKNPTKEELVRHLSKLVSQVPESLRHKNKD